MHEARASASRLNLVVTWQNDLTPSSLWKCEQPAELIDFQLTDEERYMLRRGLGEWGGPASCTDAMAVAMGFGGVPDLFAQGHRIGSELDARRPLSRWDWSRTLLATEIVFASYVVGAAWDWLTTTGMDDARMVHSLGYA